jgi:hypothetical protein
VISGSAAAISVLRCARLALETPEPPVCKPASNPPMNAPIGHDDDDRYLTRFNAGIYDPAGAREMIDRYRRVLDMVSRAPDRPVCELLEMSEIDFSPAPARWSNERT